MSLVYNEKSDEIQCVLCVYIGETEVCDTCYLIYLASSFMWLRVYESLRTCVVQIDLVWDPLQGSTTYAHPSYLLLNALDILLRNSVGYLHSTWRRRTWILEPSLIWVAVRSGDDRQVGHRLLQRLALARRAILAGIRSRQYHGLCQWTDVLWGVFDHRQCHKWWLWVLIWRRKRVEKGFYVGINFGSCRVRYFHLHPRTTMVFLTWWHHGHWCRCIHTVSPCLAHPRALTPYLYIMGDATVPW
jgi:hypothetical protein